MKLAKVYAGIGSRETPSEVLEHMASLGRAFAKKRWVLRTGGADGADEAFYAGATAEGGKVSLFLPWSGFGPEAGVDKVKRMVGACDRAMALAAKLHPAWERCSPAARLLHARNVYQVLGQKLQGPPSRFIVCWTPGGRGNGGTGGAIRLANMLRIPVFDLATTGLLDADELLSLLPAEGAKFAVPGQVRVCHVRDPETSDHRRVYVGRYVRGQPYESSVFANPYRASEWGRDAAIELYAIRLCNAKPEDPLVQKLEELAREVRDGANLELACWCAPDHCHGDALAAAIQDLARPGVLP